MKRHILVAALLGLIATFPGCQYIRPSADIPETSADAESEEKVVLQRGDVIDIKFFSAEALNDTQKVRPDGKITLQFLNEVEVQGKTPLELQNELKNRYSKIIEKPDCTVIVRGLHNRVVYVTGEVVDPGAVEMPGRMTALEAIMKAGGFKEYAKKNQVVLIREKDGSRKRYVLNIKKVLYGGGDIKPFYLAPQDMLYVPKN